MLKAIKWVAISFTGISVKAPISESVGNHVEGSEKMYHAAHAHTGLLITIMMSLS